METAGSQPYLDSQRLQKLERMSLWSCAFNNLYAAARRPDTARVENRPLSFGETCGALQQIAAVTDKRRNYAVPELLRVCLAQMLAAGYRPDRHRDAFLGLVAATQQAVDENTAERVLTEYGHAQYGRDSRELAPAPPPEYLDEQPHSVVAFPRPTEISYDGRAYTVVKKMLLRCRAKPLARFIDPAHWTALGPFFELTKPEERRDHDEDPGWHGVLHEIFKIDWNGWTTEHFDVRLRIDHTVTDDLVRADYSLLYEQYDQLHWDDGSVEISRIPGYSDWCWYKGKKSVKFASDFLNLLAPGVLFMGLEREALGIAALARLVVADEHDLLAEILGDNEPARSAEQPAPRQRKRTKKAKKR